MKSETGSKGAVAAGHQVTAGAAAGILAEGGNAFDAAIAALLTACVCEPVLASLGGGGFMMARPADGPVQLLDFFCDTPIVKQPADQVEFAEVHADFGTMTQPFHIGRGATATPGMIPGLTAIAERFATMPMADLAAPAVTAARDGIVVTPFQAYLFEVVAPILTWTEPARSLFAPDGKLLATGDRLVNPGLADALSAFAGGSMDHLLTAMVEAADPALSHFSGRDMASYALAFRDPIKASCGVADVYFNPRPASGGVLVAAMLDIVSGASSEAAAAAMAAIDGRWRTQGINAVWPKGTQTSDGAPDGGQAHRGTTHVSIIDTFGNAVSVTVSNGEGNGRIVPGCGFMMNNMLGEEDVNPDGFHNWAPGCRLSSMMTPAIAAAGDGSLYAVGSGGSNRIRTAIFQVLNLCLTRGLSLQDAVAAPRIHYEKGRLDIECADSRSDIGILCDAFPDIIRWPGRSLYFGGVHCVARNADGILSGAGDERREGVFLPV